LPVLLLVIFILRHLVRIGGSESGDLQAKQEIDAPGFVPETLKIIFIPVHEGSSSHGYTRRIVYVYPRNRGGYQKSLCINRVVSSNESDPLRFGVVTCF
jgi:hypothetical protein